MPRPWPCQSQVRQLHDGVGEITFPKVSRQYVEGVQVIDRNAKEPVYLRRMEGHRENAVSARRDKKVGNQPAPY